MALYQEIDWGDKQGGVIAGIQPDSVASKIPLQVGDELLAINQLPVQDVIDVQFHAAEERFELLLRRNGVIVPIFAERDYGEPLGIEFNHPTFDIDIRRCNNLCEFCFVLQMAPRFRRTLYIKDDDYRYSFLFGHFVTLTNLTDHDWERIEMMGLSPLYISVHVTDLERRRRFLRNPTAPDIMPQLRWLAKRGIEIHTQLVIVPGFNDGKWLMESIADLETLYPHVASVSVVPVGLTAHHKYGMRPHTPPEAAETLQIIEGMRPTFQDKFGVRFLYPSDEWYLVANRPVPAADFYDGLELFENGLGGTRRFLEEWKQVQNEILNWQREHQAASPQPNWRAILVTGTLFAGILQGAATEFERLTHSRIQVTPAINHHLGATITVAGLLMAEDIIQQLRPLPAPDIVILPRVMFDHPDTISLDDRSPQFVADHIGCPVVLADTMGDVWDALIGKSTVIFNPQNSGSIPLILSK